VIVVDADDGDVIVAVPPDTFVHAYELIVPSESVPEPERVTVDVGSVIDLSVPAEDTGAIFVGVVVCVVTDKAELCVELLPAASYAATVNEYVVLEVRPVAVYEVEVEVANCTPFLYILYPVTPKLSVDADQDIVVCVCVVLVLERLVGTDGEVVSEGGGGLEPLEY
jgi:hypothetical protein